MRAADDVWNRALEVVQAPGAREGDVALRALLAFHGAAMNGGPLHAWEVVGPEGTEQALGAFRYFDMAEAAAALAWLVSAVDGADLDDLDTAEALELQANDRYYRAVPDDGVVTRAFEQVLAREPGAFAELS